MVPITADREITCSPLLAVLAMQEFYVVEPETVLAMTDVLRHPFSLPDEPSHSGP